MVEEAVGEAAGVVACPVAGAAAEVSPARRAAEAVGLAEAAAAVILVHQEEGAIRGLPEAEQVEVIPDLPEVAVAALRGLRAVAARHVLRPAEAERPVHLAGAAALRCHPAAAALPTDLRNSQQAAAGACLRRLPNGPQAVGTGAPSPAAAAPPNSPPAIVPLNYQAAARTARVPAQTAPEARIDQGRPTGRERVNRVGIAPAARIARPQALVRAARMLETSSGSRAARQLAARSVAH